MGTLSNNHLKFRRRVFRYVSNHAPQKVRSVLIGSLTWFNKLQMKKRYKKMATANDLYYTYRLLLNRAPDQEGWDNYMLSVTAGKPVEQLVADIRSSAEYVEKMKSDGHRSYELVTAKRFQLYTSPTDTIARDAINEGGEYEPHVTKAIESLLKPGAVFVDVGASIGYFTMLAATLVGSTGKVFAFEPSQSNCRLIYMSAQVNQFKNITIHNFAVGERMGISLFTQTGSNGQLISLTPEAALDSTGTLVQVMPLDEMLSQLDRIDVIKMDIEGAEYRALTGAQQLIEKYSPTIISEVSASALQQVSCVSLDEYFAMITKRNYRVAVLESRGKRHPCENSKALAEYIAKSHQQHVDIIAESETRAH